MALDQQEEVREHLEEVDDQQGTNLDEKRMQVGTFPASAGEVTFATTTIDD